MRFEEALKNYLKTSEWKYQKAIDQGFDKNLKDPVTAREEFDQLSGIGTGNLGLAGIIRNPAMSKQLADQATAFSKVLDKLREFNVPILDETGPPYLPDGVLPYLAKAIGKYYQHVGTEKDPMYKLIEKGIVNSDNLDTLGVTEFNNVSQFNKIKDLIANSPDFISPASKSKDFQKINVPYHNTSGEKKALEEYYDQLLIHDDALTPAKNGGLDVFDYTRYPTDAGFVQVISSMPQLVRNAIDNKFLKENSMLSNRLSLPDFMSSIARHYSQNNNIGLEKWESTEPVLDVGNYEWHKLPYDLDAQLIEGRKMNNCVGDMCKAEPGYRDIYSLRWKETNTPKVNLANRPWGNGSPDIEQVLGVSNSTPKEKYYDAIQRLKAYLGVP